MLINFSSALSGNFHVSFNVHVSILPEIYTYIQVRLPFKTMGSESLKFKIKSSNEDPL